ncbi:hypothetical protein K493DRAFT_310154 [Basidiobolus meristosporus CBS 931.73]|uniref:CRIB domain-containing protein n=1 Tax=Basidiobolus meristosporus CBS 931.73 TaxID=1314790 RepID=A0A1Y1ZBG3_9FUNG|nr:hypothetical protein K493DRAFT_310154 [Basidiobolus meristosporus CBS 931.73]|eukprot:ORY07608.1 hypothetical protein K493DRAFT_310154 [Basidiobolus meristosporus CBS 931.73]
MRVPTRPTIASSKSTKSSQLPAKAESNQAKKRREISAPHNLLHITHVSISSTGEFIGLPNGWQTLLKEPTLRC